MVRPKEHTGSCTTQLSETSTASERIGTVRGFTRVLEADSIREPPLHRTRSMSPRVSASALFAMGHVRRTVASTNMRSLKREADRGLKAEHLVRKRIPVPEPAKSHFIIAGDSSLAMVKRFGRTVTHKGRFESALREEMAKNARFLGLSFHMSWGKQRLG